MAFHRPSPYSSGDHAGRWTLVAEAQSSPEGRRWHCRCDCGTERIVAQLSLRSGKSASCGCLKREHVSAAARVSRRTHGEAAVARRTPEYRSWASLVNRCCNPNNDAYPDYGGRGISVCDAWRHSFEAFLRDMGRRPSLRHSIDRIDNNRGYEPGNARWATQREQMRNTRANRLVTMRGVTLCVSDWADVVGVKPSTLGWRLRSGWPPEKALNFGEVAEAQR